MSRDLEGATLVFTPDAYGDGTEVRLFAGNPSGTLTPTTLPDLHARAIIEESTSLGKPPFAFVLHVNGALGGRPGFEVGQNLGTEVGCPASGAFHFLIHTANSSADRYVPCRVTVIATGPVALQSWQPEPTAPPPTPCSGPGCSPVTLPSPPSSSPTCPPNYSPTGTGCTPTTPPSTGAHYHVSISGASPSLNTGAAEPFTAQDGLTNAGSVAPGTPASVPVAVITTTPGICTVTPSGSQASGTTFSLTGLATGACTITAAADTTAVPNATADTAQITVTISTAPNPTPTSSGCDLTENGQCFHRIVQPTTLQFTKAVMPGTVCSSDDTCSYTNSISAIILDPPFNLQPPVSPVDTAHELLFEIDEITQVTSECLPYVEFKAIEPPTPILWNGGSIGAPANAPTGIGQPSEFLTLNHVFPALPDGAADFSDLGQPWSQGTTLAELYDSLASERIGAPSAFLYASQSLSPGATIQWYPDFPGCDAAGDPEFESGFGISGIQITFQVYQSRP